MARYPGNFTDSDLLSVPRNLKVRPDHDTTHLAYITDKEAKLLQKNKPGTPHKGPEGIPNYDGGDILDYRPTTPGLREAGYSGRVDPGGGRQPQDRPQNAQQEQRDRQQQEIINRNNANRIAKMKADKKEAAIARAKEIAVGAPAAERVWDPKADDWAKDYSYSTKDVRSSVVDRRDFRKRVEEGGWAGTYDDQGNKIITKGGGKSEVKTEAENIALAAYDLTNDPKYLNMPIYNPKGLYESRLDPVTGEWSADPGYDALFDAYAEAKKTGNNEIFFAALGKTQDITAGNPNIDYSTSYDPWYKGPTTTGGGGGGGWSGWGSGGGGGGGGGGYYGPQSGYTPQQMAGFYTPQANLQQAMINVHQSPTVFKKRGGIVSLLRLS